jgi:hypothetical protein
MTQFGYNGQQGWFRKQQIELAPDMAEFFMCVALFEVSLAHLAWSYQSDDATQYGLDSVMERLPFERWQGRACEVVVSRGLLPFPIYHYIAQDTYEEVYRRAQIPKGQAYVDVALELMPASELSDQLRMPMGYKLYLDGALYDTVNFHRIRANITILSSLFEAPIDAFMTNLAPRS